MSEELRDSRVWVCTVPEQEWAPLTELLDKERYDAFASVYANYDHRYNRDVRLWLLAEPGRMALHAAWEYCGHVWVEGDVIHEQVHRYGIPIAEYKSNDLDALIRCVVDEHGRE